MARAKFRFNPVTLSYERIELTRKQWIKRFFKDTFLVGGIAIFILYTASFFIESPSIKKLRVQQEDYLFKYDLINSTLEQYSNELEQIAFYDDNLYRVYFETDPLPANIRNSGFGGVNRYKSLEQSKHADVMIETSRQVDHFFRKILTQSTSFDEIENLAVHKGKLMAAKPSIQPIAISELTRFGSSFGMRVHPLQHVRKMHEGIDLTAPRGTKIYASADGKALYAGNTSGGYGKMVLLDHGFGYRTLYAHCSKILIKHGESVKRGDVIAEVGSTGLSSGPHLHYEVHHHGRPVNPINFYANDLTAEEYDKMIAFLENSDPGFDIN